MSGELKHSNADLCQVISHLQEAADVDGVLLLSVVLAEQEGENLSGLSNNPDKAIFAVRENGTTCLMVEFAVKFLVPYDVLALNGIDLITEQASFTLPRSAEIEGKCGSTESEIHISWKNNAYVLRIYFSKEFRDKGTEVWKISKVQFVYDTSETSHFINAYNPGKHTASTHRLSALVTPAGHSYVCTAQQTLTLISSDHQKGVTVSMYDIQIQPFDIASDFMFSEPYKCITDQRERLEETLPLVLGLILGLIIVITLTVYHFHLKLTANQPQLPRDRSMYKNIALVPWVPPPRCNPLKLLLMAATSLHGAEDSQSRKREDRSRARQPTCFHWVSNIPQANLRHGYRRGRVRASRSAVAVVSHERDNAGRGSRQLEEGVLEELLGRGSLRGFPHQHQVRALVDIENSTGHEWWANCT
ncbi:hypothetical protein INR49_027232 [Caranx melampygus]|nr:hypothetical protein INR49_027232 [Caranx melampygus]